MSGSIEPATARFSKQVTDIVAAYVGNNSVPIAELPALMGSVDRAVADLLADARIARDQPKMALDPGKPTTAQIKKSIRPEGLVSFIDGKVYKTLKRHLTSRGFSPRTYRDRYGLPDDYPMVAREYAERRAAIALGRPSALPAPAAASIAG